MAFSFDFLIVNIYLQNTFHKFSQNLELELSKVVSSVFPSYFSLMEKREYLQMNLFLLWAKRDGDNHQGFSHVDGFLACGDLFLWLPSSVN